MHLSINAQSHLLQHRLQETVKVFGTFLARLLTVCVSKCPAPQSWKLRRSAAPHSQPPVHRSLRESGRRGHTCFPRPVFPVRCPLLPRCEWWLSLLVRLFLQPNLTKAKCWHWWQCQTIPTFCFSLGKKSMTVYFSCLVWCFLTKLLMAEFFPLRKGLHQLRHSLSPFPAGPSGSLSIHHHPSASGSPSSQGEPEALPCLKHFELPRTLNATPM